MKKKWLTGHPYEDSLKKIMRIMRLTLMLLFGCMITVSANSYAQKTRLDVNMSNTSIRDLFGYIEDNSEFVFLYRNEDFNVLKKVEINLKDATINQILDQALKGENVTYNVYERQIVIQKAGEVLSTQQMKELSGIVKDNQGHPLTGVTVKVKGTSIGTVTDVNGQFKLSVSKDVKTISFSFIGMTKQDIDIKDKTSFTIVMAEEINTVEEVVAIGYGTRKKKDLTGSISTVNSKDMEKINSLSPQFALQGNTTGVRVTATSGDPNAAPSIFIRGVGTWQGSGQPLYVIDGQIITAPHDGNVDVISAGNRDTPPNLWTLINPDDIESMSVLKDASAAAIYGSRGANGVILIKTKRGKKGEASIEFNATHGIQNIPTYNMLNTQQYVDLVHEMYANNTNPDITIEKNLYGRNEADDNARRIGYSPQFDPSSPYYISSRQTYNWQNNLIRSNALDNAYDIKLSGANEKVDYYMSLGYRNQESNFVGGGFEHYTAALNLNSQVNKWLKVGVNYKFAHQKTLMDDQTDLLNIANGAPWQPIFDSSTKSGYANVLDPPAGGWQPTLLYGQGSKNNYLAITNLNRSDFTLDRQIGQGYIEIAPISGLTLRGSINLDISTQDRRMVSVYSNDIFFYAGGDPAKQAPNAPNALGSMSDRVNKIFNYQSDFTATYEKSFGKHRINATAATQDQYNIRNYFDYSGSNLTNMQNLEKLGYGADGANNNSFVGRDEKYWFGMVGRLSYIYDDKYYIDLSYRRDASNGFAKAYRWGNFYSASGAWRISKETFMQDLTWLDDLKLRGGWGQAGNDESVVGGFAYLSRAGGSGSYSFGSGNGNGIGNYNEANGVTGFPNAELTWEVVGTTYGGFDASLFGNKLTATLEIYNRRTSGIQQYVNLPLSVGTDAPAFNIGTLENRGADIMVGYNNKVGDFTYGISGNISFLKNEVISLYNDQPLFISGIGLASNGDAPAAPGNGLRVEKGRSIGTIWGYKVGGIFKTQAEINSYYAPGPNDPTNQFTGKVTDQTIGDKYNVRPGDMYFQNVGGNPTVKEPNYSTKPDSLINNYDQTAIGNTIPGYTYGINLSAGWKGIDFSLSFYGEGDVQKYNDVAATLESMNGLSNFSTSVLDRWTVNNPSKVMPRAVIGDPAGNNRFSDRFVESAAYFKLNNWQLGYSLPNQIMRKINFAVKSARFFISGSNNIYITNWSGLDPVNDRKPLPRTFSVGLKAKF